MNNLKNLEEACKQLQAQLDEHKAMIQLLKCKPSKVRQRVPKGDVYWLIDTSSGTSFDNDSKDLIDSYRFSVGNYYYSEQEAQQALDKQLATMRIFDKLRELEGYWEADWGDEGQRKYTYFINFGGIDTTFWGKDRPSNDPRWYSTLEARDWVFENMMDDLKLAWGVIK